ncbi:hypothetical protein GCM10008959_30180 [Deinococcus seoulensis]|uniref:Thiol:disulfide interchange protein DsbD N-terminal domain-containing protein n=1 Tax=Deinococcus seoulensis TaxID=1837379 RepID=A0ABQ2RU95_9DEIO|nr:hypothetical protein [Deinococcus seoulensis]GGR65893.1 hypothetical protein GCM10008959_30180 [Deinococcus seoulensis]
MKVRWYALSGLLLLTSVALLSQQRAAKAELTLVTFRKNGVQVAVLARPTGEQTVAITAVFTPQPGFHMYSVDLPAEGIDGLGRPTRFELAAPSTGELSPQFTVTPEEIHVVSAASPEPMPVYPAGPVRLTRQLRLDSTSSAVTLDARFSYMSCDDARGCTVPVRDHHERIDLKGIR